MVRELAKPLPEAHIAQGGPTPGTASKSNLPYLHHPIFNIYVYIDLVFTIYYIFTIYSLL